jgi:hypothetical protein
MPTVNQLKGTLRSRGVSTLGNKAELMARLEQTSNPQRSNPLAAGRDDAISETSAALDLCVGDVGADDAISETSAALELCVGDVDADTAKAMEISALEEARRRSLYDCSRARVALMGGVVCHAAKDGNCLFDRCHVQGMGGQRK